MVGLRTELSRFITITQSQLIVTGHSTSAEYYLSAETFQTLPVLVSKWLSVGFLLRELR